METEMSLDDIIQKNFKPSIRGKRGGRAARGGKGKNVVKATGGVQTNQNKNVSNNRGIGGLQGRNKGRGGGNRHVTAPIGDARLRIIQQKRQKITDAREKLGEIAKMSDARNKLNNLHRKAIVGGPMVGTNLSRRGGIIVEKGRNGQIQLSTNKIKVANQQTGPYKEPSRVIGNGRGHIGNRNTIIPSLLDIDLDAEDDPPLLLRRTVNNSLLSPPRLPVFSSPQQRDTFTWIKPQTDEIMNDAYEHVHMARSRPTARPPILRDSILGPSLRRHAPTNIKIHTRNTSPKPTSDWFLGERATKRTLRETRPVSRERVLYSDEDEPLPRSRNESRLRVGGVGVKSRLLTSAPVPRSMGILSSESRSAVPAETRPPANYHRIIVSNLQKSVTNEDIRELFEDVASLVSSKLVRPGTAEVVYRNRKDAEKAVEIYHNRQLDGEPMKCMLVNPRPLPTQAQPSASRNASTGSSHIHGVSSKYLPSSKSQKPTVYPDMDTIHKALFKRS